MTNWKDLRTNRPEPGRFFKLANTKRVSGDIYLAVSHDAARVLNGLALCSPCGEVTLSEPVYYELPSGPESNRRPALNREWTHYVLLDELISVPVPRPVPKAPSPYTCEWASDGRHILWWDTTGDGQPFACLKWVVTKEGIKNKSIPSSQVPMWLIKVAAELEWEEGEDD
jgi:hypothetical protein